MTFRDTWATCDKCGMEFVLTVEEQRRRATKGEEGGANVCPACQGRKPRSIDRDQVQERPSLDSGQGEVKWYDPEKGYGFLVRHTGDEVFFHRTRVLEEDHRRLLEGARVTYELEETDKGLQAVNVALVEE